MKKSRTQKNGFFSRVYLAFLESKANIYTFISHTFFGDTTFSGITKHQKEKEERIEGIPVQNLPPLVTAALIRRSWCRRH